MTGNPIKRAAEALKLFVKSIKSDCYFNILSYGTMNDALFDKSVECTHETISRAIEYIDKIDANYGGTEIYSALKWAFENAQDKIPTEVFLLTDGLVWDVDKTIRLVQEAVKKRD